MAASSHFGPDEGSPLKKARESAGLTLAALGARLDVSGACIHRWENGQREPSEDVFVALRGSVFGAAELQGAHGEWLRGHKPARLPRRGTLTIRTAIPKGISDEQARDACVEALSLLAAGGAR